MIKIDVCAQCKSKNCCDFKDGITIYELIKLYITEYLHELEVEFSITECKCSKVCNGPIVKIDDKVYTNVNQKKALEIIRELALDKERYRK